MSYGDTIRYLYNLQKYGIKFGLENINKLMFYLGNPHQSFHSIHIAGTNGKGSTAAMIASILQSAGFRVGLFTSPHLVSFTERIRVSGEEIEESDVIHLASKIKNVVSRYDDFSPTFFEVVTAMAMLYFKRKKIDIAVIEVGMGGRLDATNIVSPQVTVITRISYDHKEFLGNTVREIAHEKAGIIKESVPVVSAEQEHDAEEVIKTVADKNSAPLFIYGKDFEGIIRSSDIQGITFNYRNDTMKLDDLFIPLAGEHQLQNASAAVKASLIALKKISLFSNPPIPPLEKGCKNGFETRQEEIALDSILPQSFIQNGLSNVKWPGRLEFINDNPPIIIDGAHNPAAARALSEALGKIFKEKFQQIIMILGIMGDKDIKGIIEPLLPLASEIILTSPSYSRAASPEQLAAVAESLGYKNIHTVPTVQEAIEIAKAKSVVQNLESEDKMNLMNTSHLAPHLSLILITGSFYTIGEAKEMLGQKGMLSRLRE